MRRKQDITIISGTGRAGTTFLMRIFVILEMNTGFSSDALEFKNEDNGFGKKGHVFFKSNSGLEKQLRFKANSMDCEIIKQPCAYIRPNAVKKICNFYNPHWIIPIRNAEEVSKSRAKLKNGPGGFWPQSIKNEDDQRVLNHKMLSEFLHVAVELGIEDNITYLDFKKIKEDPIYVFNKLKFLFDKYGIEFTKFKQAYITADRLSKLKSNKVSS